MAYSRDDMRSLLVRRKARLFAEKVRGTNMAFKLGDELIDWLRDEEIPTFKDHLHSFGLVQRGDTLWEER